MRQNEGSEKIDKCQQLQIKGFYLARLVGMNYSARLAAIFMGVKAQNWVISESSRVVVCVLRH